MIGPPATQWARLGPRHADDADTPAGTQFEITRPAFQHLGGMLEQSITRLARGACDGTPDHVGDARAAGRPVVG